MAQAIGAAFDAEAMIALAEAAGVKSDQIALARLDLLHEQARERAKERFGI